ncbi:hypothetical protein [Vreelandella maris]|uniref:Uncharacterized protein n=1 Tax=Vreelandella maris TaxID=2729617 RepID=A0A7Y6R9Q8_9GAMM|nr:hypothetical protein [Halomonas maris]NVF12979.1 hypothetical protein [Halomonas maris]
MPTRPPPLLFPSALDPLAYVIGFGKCVMLARLTSDRPLHFPPIRCLDENHWLAAVLGIDDATEACKVMAGRLWAPPSARDLLRPINARMVLEYCDIASPIPEIAELTDMTPRKVHLLLSAVAVWYTTGDLEAAADLAEESQWFMSLLLNKKC